MEHQDRILANLITESMMIGTRGTSLGSMIEEERMSYVVLSPHPFLPPYLPFYTEGL